MRHPTLTKGDRLPRKAQPQATLPNDRLGELWPLVDVLVRGEPGALRWSVMDGDGLVALGSAEPQLDAELA